MESCPQSLYLRVDSMGERVSKLENPLKSSPGGLGDLCEPRRPIHPGSPTGYKLYRGKLDGILLAHHWFKLVKSPCCFCW